MKTNRFRVWVLGALLTVGLGVARSVHAQVNSWSDPGNAAALFKWEDGTKWSLGTPPNSTEFAFLTNAAGAAIGHNRVVNVDPTTATNNLINGCMTVDNLTVSAPKVGTTSSFNTLLLHDVNNFNGSGQRLAVLNTLTISTRGTVTITNSVLRVGPPGTLAIDGTVLLNTGSLITSNFQSSTVNTFVGDTSPGQLTVLDGEFGGGEVYVGFGPGAQGTMGISNGTSQAADIALGVGAGSAGTLTLGGGALTLLSSLQVGSGQNSTGAVWLTGGQLIATASVSFAHVQIGVVGAGQMIVSNGIWQARSVSVGSHGTLTIMSGNTAGIISVSGDSNGIGSVWINGGVLAGSLFVGSNGVAAVSNGTWTAGGATISGQGTLTMAGGTNTWAGFTINPLIDTITTGTLWLTGGQLISTGGVSYVGQSARSRMTVSNGTWRAGEVDISNDGTQDPDSELFPESILTVAGGTHTFSGPFALGVKPGGVGTLWMTGGQLSVTNSPTMIGSNGVGQVTISNGTYRATAVVLGQTTLSAGTLTIAGGTCHVYSNLTVGTFACMSVAQMFMSGGTLYVTNAAHNALLEVRGGTLTMTGGSIVADRIAITNSCGFIDFTGGSITYNTVALDPNRDDDGDGYTNSQELQAGTNPLDPNSHPTVVTFRITSITRTNNNIVLKWQAVGGTTNQLQVTAGGGGGSYATNGFTNLGAQILMGGSGSVITNYTDVGGATNKPARYYRVRLVP